MVSKEIEQKINKISVALETFEEGKPLPISVADIHFVVGACTQYAINQEKLEETYKRDMETATSELTKFRDKWKVSRKHSVRLDEKITKYKQVVEAAKKLVWWQRSKGLQKQLGVLEELERKRPVDFTA